MANRVSLSDEVLKDVIGGMAFTWNGVVGHCGLTEDDMPYTFNNRTSFIDSMAQCRARGLSDAESIQVMLADGVIY